MFIGKRMTAEAAGWTALEIGSHALTAVALANPIGAMGGAIYGATRVVTGIISSEYFSVDPSDGRMLQAATAIAQFSISVLGSWKLVGALGVNMSLKAAVISNIISIGVAFGLMGAMGVLAVAKNAFTNWIGQSA
jgi:hypothetical protein